MCLPRLPPPDATALGELRGVLGLGVRDVLAQSTLGREGGPQDALDSR
jgi:hypothetical protein